MKLKQTSRNEIARERNLGHYSRLRQHVMAPFTNKCDEKIMPSIDWLSYFSLHDSF